MKKLIYISGPVTGRSMFDVMQRFSEGGSFVRKHLDGIPVSPMKFAIDGLKDKGRQMAIDLAVLRQCDGIYMLEEWDRSEGACAELAVAEATGMTIYYEEDERGNDLSVSE